MSTKMTEDDWRVALEIFRASSPRRGDKGRDDRLLLEAKGKPGFFAKAIYKGRARIEQAVGKLKRFKRVALQPRSDRLVRVARADRGW
ncbi:MULTISPECIES: hypothetical protein [Rhizobium]|uniref:Transposase n=1 Tax=Rhizobium favelukesii TaxID=348824 RepID=W6RM41_9HYPH|nr:MULTISPECIES: hypothetical protein [Rhizobium]MCS0463541.1 hypothetical protein [Rhizobium favelukesii]UFS84580.1 hypothetical protein LPB79_32265 [Rhizobium sp. T136]CDM60008.1 hypothetical protein LPU83_pLPU83b_0008 [Rhizobium favelukesii]